MKKLNLRWRLTLWNTFSAAVLLLVCGSLVYGMLRQAMVRQTDQLLQAQLAELHDDQMMASDYQSRIPHWIREFKEHVNVFAAVYDSHGQLIFRTEGLAEVSVPPDPIPDTNELRFATQMLPIIDSQRTLAGNFPAGNESFSVVLMSPLAEVETNLARVRTVMFTAFPLALLLAGAIGYWQSRKALAPIERLREKTDRITADKLDQRLPVDNPDDELGRMTETINEMIARLERSFLEIRRFTADASHELRTPLAVLRAEVEVAMRTPMDEPQRQNLLASVLEEIQRLSGLTDQLLTLSRTDAGMAQYARELIDLNQLVHDVVQTMKPLADAKQQTLVCTGTSGACVVGDVGKLRQVFYNLLDNSIKYTPENGKIEVSLSSTSDFVHVQIKDNGIGIPAEHLPHLFERFYRVDKSRSREQGGTGLGLSIVKTIIVAHEGEIQITSQPDQGMTCTIQLPLARG